MESCEEPGPEARSAGESARSEKSASAPQERAPASGEPKPGEPKPAQAARELDEVLLGSPRTLSVDELADAAHVDGRKVRDYWRTLGLPITEGEEPAFTKDDASALAQIFSFAEREHFDDRVLTALIRSTGHTTERLAFWQVEALVELEAKLHGLDDANARRLVLDRLPDFAPLLEKQLLHAWRRQLAAVAGRYVVEFSDPHAGAADDSELPLLRAVGFADIVEFTRRTQGLRSGELAEFVEQFEANARDVVTACGGRVVKTIGDAVLFIADGPVTGAQVALGLAATAGEDGRPPVRVSMVWGRVLARFGDVFGPVVNLAARLSDVAEPCTVLVDTGTARELGKDSRFALTARPEVHLHGFGTVKPVRLEWAYRD